MSEEREPSQQTHDQRRRVRQRDELRELRETNKRLLASLDLSPQILLENNADALDPVDLANFRQIMRERRLPQRYVMEAKTLLSQVRQRGMTPEIALQAVLGRDQLRKRARKVERVTS